MNVLPQFLESYNNTFQTSFKRTPASVNVDNQEEVFQNLYAESKIQSPKLKMGGVVRLSMNGSTYLGWSLEHFVMHQAFFLRPAIVQNKRLA